jgi:hypothetical protein
MGCVKGGGGVDVAIITTIWVGFINQVGAVKTEKNKIIYLLFRL